MAIIYKRPNLSFSELKFTTNEGFDFYFSFHSDAGKQIQFLSHGSLK